MDLIFQKGSKESPKGHALLYFTNKDNSSEIWGTYIITLPIEVDIKKYMPPFLVNDNNAINSSQLSKLLFAIENSQDSLISECEKDIESLATFYPENHKINKIVEYTKIKNKSKIAELYFKRCLYLAKENYEKVEEYEKLIEQQEN